MRDRRYVVVDEQRGVVMAEACFDHGATFEDYKTTDGKAAKNPIKSPSTISLMEMFKIRKGRIYRIEAIFTGSAVPDVLAMGAAGAGCDPWQIYPRFRSRANGRRSIRIACSCIRCRPPMA